MSIETADAVVWRPDAHAVDRSRLMALIRHCGATDYDDLLAKADADADWFWATLIDFLDIRFERPYDVVCDQSDGKPWARWCVGGRMNLAANCLDKHRGTDIENKVAVIAEGEDGTVKTSTYRDIDDESARLANGLRELGLGAGDAVGIYLPMMAEVAVAYMAVVRIGAIVVPLFSGFGVDAITTRLEDAEAKAVITVDGTTRRGRVVDMKSVIDEALADLPKVRHVVVLDSGRTAVTLEPGRDIDWRDLTARQSTESATEFVDADAPLLLVYTSGTTGRPKGAILSHCGAAVKTAYDFGVQMDLGRDDRLIWMTDFGWVVGPMTIAAAFVTGATIIIAEGVPDYPDAGRLWRLVQDQQASFVGISPTAVRGLMRGGTDVVGAYNLSSIRVTASTGEPWTPEAWHWLFEHVCKRRAPIINWSGGTEIGGGILCGSVIHPMKPCAFAGPMPGMAADIVNETGDPVGPGEVGELVLRAPSIGLTRSLWKDPERYIETYWSTFEGLWRHGDWASRDQDGMWYVHGRSDDTLKIAGKRTGPAEIEGLVMATGLVSECAAIGIPDKISGQAVMCVCVAAPGVAAGTDFDNAVAEAIGHGLGKPFRPKRILVVGDLPKTRSLKIMRRVVKAVVIGDPPGDLSAMVNPDAVDALRAAAAG